jgi:hypothetical protein
MIVRRRLSDRRSHELVETVFRGGPYTIGVGRFEDGGLAEIFIDCQAKGLTPISDDAKDAAVCLSIALQFGAPAHVIREAVTRTTDGAAVGVIGNVLDLLSEKEISK